LLCGCIDIGSNTTRVLVAEARDGRLLEVLQRRAFTRIGQGLTAGAEIPRAKIDEVAQVVGGHRRLAEEAGAEHVRAVATAAIRRAANRDEFVSVVRDTGGVDVAILDGDEEARLAFVGATRTLGRELPGIVGVVDVGGGSTEIAVGTVAGGVTWSRSFALGSGLLADTHLRSDPPAPAELEAMRAGTAVAVGGSAASLPRLVGSVCEPTAIRRALEVLSTATIAEVAERFTLDPERVRLLPAGILILDAAAHRLGCPLLIGRGGLREGVLLELAGGGIIGGGA
jgi:exopolyphosphatase/guanosine-5'-triphosphate,3'-diphosphate pyrophosphatase